MLLAISSAHKGKARTGYTVTVQRLIIGLFKYIIFRLFQLIRLFNSLLLQSNNGDDDDDNDDVNNG